MFHKSFFSSAKSDMINHAFNFPRIGLTILRTLATEVWPAQLPSSVFKRIIILLYPKCSIHNQVRFQMLSKFVDKFNSLKHCIQAVFVPCQE